MTDLEDLLIQILAFGPNWEITKIRLDKASKEIDIYVHFKGRLATFPGSKKESQIYDYSQSRRIRHLDIVDYKAFINVRIPRVKNEDGTEIRKIDLGWADDRVSFSFLFENRVIEALLLSKNQTKTAEFFDTTFDIVHSIMVRAVNRGLLRRDLEDTKALSLDEKSFSHGHKYITVLSDPFHKCVLDVIEGRKSEDTEELILWTLSPSQLEKVILVTMDMWQPYLKTVKEILPHAKIIHDKFHTAKYLNKGVDETRKEEVKKEEILKNSKYLFVKTKENWTDRQTFQFNQIDQINLKTSIAWHLKENFKGIYHLGNKYLCLNYFKEWYENTLNSGIKQMIKVADTLLNHLEGIINSAIYEVSNATAENLNAQIQVVKSVARGYANFKGYRNAILFFQGKLKLFPL